jgi:hypothetical protein
MKRYIILSICALFFISFTIQAQDTIKNPVQERKNYIKGGFYLGLGPVFPMQKYSEGQIVQPTSGAQKSSGLVYLPAKIGAALDMGFLIYFGPAFANKHLRLGLDATFLSFWFNSTTPVLNPGNSYEHYYYYAGQKFGPLLTINPVDRLLIDISYKLNANFAYHFDEWDSYSSSDFSKYGANLFQNEVSLSIRYAIMRFSIQYNFGNMKYDNFEKSRPTQTVETNTLRILLGLKF